MELILHAYIEIIFPWRKSRIQCHTILLSLLYGQRCVKHLVDIGHIKFPYPFRFLLWIVCTLHLIHSALCKGDVGFSIPAVWRERASFIKNEDQNSCMHAGSTRLCMRKSFMYRAIKMPMQPILWSSIYFGLPFLLAVHPLIMFLIFMIRNRTLKYWHIYLGRERAGLRAWREENQIFYFLYTAKESSVNLIIFFFFC